MRESWRKNAEKSGGAKEPDLRRGLTSQPMPMLKEFWLVKLAAAADAMPDAMPPSDEWCAEMPFCPRAAWLPAMANELEAPKLPMLREPWTPSAPSERLAAPNEACEPGCAMFVPRISRRLAFEASQGNPAWRPPPCIAKWLRLDPMLNESALRAWE